MGIVLLNAPSRSSLRPTPSHRPPAARPHPRSLIFVLAFKLARFQCMTAQRIAWGTLLCKKLGKITTKTQRGRDVRCASSSLQRRQWKGGGLPCSSVTLIWICPHLNRKTEDYWFFIKSKAESINSLTGKLPFACVWVSEHSAWVITYLLPPGVGAQCDWV